MTMTQNPIPHPTGARARRHRRRIVWRTTLLSALALVLAIGTTIFWQLQASALPERLNMGSASSASTPHYHGAVAPDADARPGTGAPITNTAAVTSVTDLVAAASDAPTRTFHLTAQTATLDLGGQAVDAWTFNGSAPGPELRVQQGDQVVVEVTNQLAVGLTIHWHGVAVPNAVDGVAGLTQDAIRPGESYTYRFTASEAGTFWYHTHQEASIGVPRGLYGVLIVEPKQPPVHYDRDYTLVLSEWTLPRWWLPRCNPPFPACTRIVSVNGRRDGLQLDARPGDRIRLRIVDAGARQHLPALVGAPFRVVALDGHDLHEPQEVSGLRLPLGAGQRYDLDMVMPDGPVALIDAAPLAN